FISSFDGFADSDVILLNEEHQGYEWILPEEIKDKDFIFDLGAFLQDSFNIERIDIKTTEDKINETIEIINKSFDEGILLEEDYFNRLSQLNIIKSNYDNSIEKRNNDEGEFVVRLKKADESDFNIEYQEQ